MCGIAGILHWGAHPDAAERAGRMAAAMRHRGPDGVGAWSDARCALGHTRLSILDLPGGAQPMANETGEVQVVYNGEIYNHRDLRRQLEAAGHVFRSDHSDTEVIVHGWEQWGADLLPRLNGMFAFAVWDARAPRLFLGRDRYGIKPVYLARLPDEGLVFASDVRAILASGLIEKREDPAGILEYFSFQNLLGARTMFAGVEMFPPAHGEEFTQEGAHRRRYWDFSFPRSNHRPLSEVADQYRDLLVRVVTRQLEADVPVAAYLSGGVDSSGIACAAHARHAGLRAYTCTYDLNGVGSDRHVDEREFARAMATHLGIAHTEFQLPQDTLRGILDDVVRAIEVPRMGMCYVNYMTARRVSQDARVVLSGTGGDEVHGGYVGRYQVVRRAAGLTGLVRRIVRRLQCRPSVTAASVYRDLLNFPIAEPDLRRAFTPEFLSAAGEFSPTETVRSFTDACPSDRLLDQVLYVDARTYLHGLLIMEDKYSMAHSLETRVPLLDNDLVDFVCDLPWSALFDGETGKLVFRRAIRPWVPDHIYRKSKMGFGPPEASWYRGALRPWLEEELAEARIAARGVLQPAFVRATLEDHFAGRRENHYVIWSLLCFEAWCRGFGTCGGDTRRLG